LSTGRRLDRIAAGLACPECAARERSALSPAEAQRELDELLAAIRSRWECGAGQADLAERAAALRSEADRLDYLAGEAR